MPDEPGKGRKIAGLPRGVVIGGAVALAAGVLWFWWKSRKASQSGTLADTGAAPATDYTGMPGGFPGAVGGTGNTGDGTGGTSGGGVPPGPTGPPVPAPHPHPHHKRDHDRPPPPRRIGPPATLPPTPFWGGSPPRQPPPQIHPVPIQRR